MKALFDAKRLSKDAYETNSNMRVKKFASALRMKVQIKNRQMNPNLHENFRDYGA